MNWRSLIWPTPSRFLLPLVMMLPNCYLASGTERLPAPNLEESRASTAAISKRRIATEVLQPLGEPTEQENREFNAALDRFAARTSRDDFAALTDFLAAYPKSSWRASLLADLGEEYYRTGHFSKALAAWEAVWQERPGGGTNQVLALPIQHAAAALANLYARLGRMEPLRGLLQEIHGVPIMGNYAKQLEDARFGLSTMDERPEIAFRCGPLALDRIRAWQHPTNACHPLIFNSKSTTNGICLRDVSKLAHDLGMDYQIAFRNPGAKLIVPAVIHWKVGHYAAIVREAHGLFLSQDPTFWNDTWASQPTLDEEASGYFLVPAGRLPPGWRSVDDLEARGIWGKGTTVSADPDATSDRDDKLNDDGCHGMATWDFNLMLVNQRISDTPIGYRPPVGPSVYFIFTMSAQDNWMRQFASWWGTTLGLNWSCNWNSFIQDDPLNPSSNIRVYDQGGWLTFIEDPTQTGVFRCQFRNPGYITVLSTNGMFLGYAWNLPDGGRKIYGNRYAPNGSTTGFSLLTAVVDPAGNAVTIEYDPGFPGKVTAIVDAIGQRTTLEYGLSDPGFPPPSPISQGNVQFNWQVTRITDPFGRSATFQYQVVQDGAPPAYFYYLTNITDVAGLSSQMTFYPGWAQDSFPVMPALTTPYGTTRFKGFIVGNRDFGVDVTDPEGAVERLQYCESQFVNVPASELQQNVPTGLDHAENAWLYSRNVYYWNKKAFAEGLSPTAPQQTSIDQTNDYSNAVIYHFTHAQNLAASGPILESIKRPLENRIWFNYPGQGAGWFPGSDDHPSKVGRVLDDASTQLWQFGYNSYGNLTNSIDPMGRTFSFIYDTNEIDLLKVRQTRNGQNELLFSVTYNRQHLPTQITDAAGQRTDYTYNLRGQVLTVVNAKNETNSFEYDAKGYLTAIDGPLSGPQDRNTFTYDAAGRLRTAADQDGYTVTLDYDNLDRMTRVTYPDGTYHEIVYDRLHPGTIRDRLGRVSTCSYTSLGQLASIQDPLGRMTQFQWCRCGDLESIVDPLGRITSWIRDIQGRVTAKQYADGSTVQYTYEQTTGRVRNIRDEKNQVTQFDYYPDDSLKRKSYLNAVVPTPSVQFTYDTNYPRLTGMQDGPGTTTFAYYPITVPPALGAGQLAAIDAPLANDTITYQYDELQRAVARTLNGVTERFVFDAGGRLQQLTNFLGAFGYSWEGGSSRLSSVQYPNGQVTRYTYYPNQKDQLLQSITHYLPNQSVLSQFSYDYDVQQRITNWVQLQGGVTKTWGADYDDGDRLTSVDVLQNGSLTHSYRYSYDDANNRTLNLVDGARRNFYYNDLNQLTAASNSPLNGFTYEWDAEHRLVAINNGTHRSEFRYDGLDRRVRVTETDSGATNSDQQLVYSGMGLLEARDTATQNVVMRHSYFGDDVMTGTDGLVPGRYFYTHDHLGSGRDITDASGAIISQASYDPFGIATLLSGTTYPSEGFAGLRRHLPSGIGLGWERAYDSVLGRWINRDPLGEIGGANTYSYVSGDPLNHFDPTGLDESRPDLLTPDTGNSRVDSVIKFLEKGAEKIKAIKEPFGKAKKFYETTETVVEVKEDYNNLKQAVGNDCDIGDLNDPSKHTMKELQDKPRDAVKIFDTLNKYLKKALNKIPGSKAVTGPAVELGPEVLNTGVKNVDAYVDRLNQKQAEADYLERH